MWDLEFWVLLYQGGRDLIWELGNLPSCHCRWQIFKSALWSDPSSPVLGTHRVGFPFLPMCAKCCCWERRKPWHVQSWQRWQWMSFTYSHVSHPCLLGKEKYLNSLVLWPGPEKSIVTWKWPWVGQHLLADGVQLWGCCCHHSGRLQMTGIHQETQSEDTNCGPPKLLLWTTRQEPVFTSNLSGLILFFSNNWKLMSWSESRCSCHLLNWDIKWGSVDMLTNLTAISLS